MKKNLFCLILLLLSAANLYAQEEITFGIYVHELTIDEKNENFTADFYWWQKFKMPEDSTLLDEISTPEFIHSVVINADPIRPIIKNGYVYVSGRYRGRFSFDADFHDYPMDSQILPIKIENINLTSNYMLLKPDTVTYGIQKKHMIIPGIDTFVVIPDYKVVSAGYKTYLKDYYCNMNDSALAANFQYSRLVFNIFIQRESFSFLLKILIPNILLLLIAYMAFLLPASRLDVSVSCTITSLLASIALQFTINSALPDVGYMTKADKMFYLFYILITYALVHAVYNFKLDQASKKSVHLRKTIGKILFPLLTIGGLTWILSR